MLSLFRHYASPLALLAALPLAAPSLAQNAKPAATSAEPTPWLYRNSDIPPDKEWIFGELKNGLRYAVRKNGVPPGQVSIRVAIDAGSLNELKGEEGFAHFNEHLSYRRSKYATDGEAKRLFQRLGAMFGSDTNAATTPTQTIYKLDLPSATPAKLEQAVKVLSGMMSAPVIGPAQVDAERRTVLAELREGSGPGQRVGDATRETFFTGQPLGKQSPIGTMGSLQSATADGMRGFHDRWYRPEKALVVISGDGDPAMFGSLIKKNFSSWKGKGPTPADPDFGKPDPAAPRTRIVVEPGLPTLVSLTVLRPWFLKNDTIAYNRGKLVEALALRLISRRLEERARAGGSFLSASVDQQDVSRSVDGTFVQIVPLGDNWQAAITDVRAVIADALINPSTQADIDREANEFLSALQVSVEQQRTQNGGDLADNLIEAVNIRETVASPEVAYDVFAGSKDSIKPTTILEATKRMFAGAPMRAILTTPKEIQGGDGLLLAALTSAPKPLAAIARNPVSFDRVPKLPAPGTVTSRRAVAAMGLDFVTFSNGVRAIIFANNAEAGNVYVSVRFGKGMKALPANRPTDAWAAAGALIASGIGDLKQDELDRLTSARRINMGFSIADDAFVLTSTTRAVDLPDQLKLLAAKLAYPGWDPAPVVRAKAAMVMSFSSSDTTPGTVLARAMPGLLHGGDPRWTYPTLAQVQAMTPQSFRALWEPLLATGPIEISVFGDVDKDAAINAIAASLGALPVRTEAVVADASASSPGVTANTEPKVLTHRGPADQAAAVLAWPTAGGTTGTYESRKLDVLAAIFNDRMFDQLREGEGASYSPNVSSTWPPFMTGGGAFTVTSQLNPKGVDRFFALSKSIAADLAAKPPSADEIARSVGPLKQYVARASSGNGFWLGQLQGATSDPSRITNVASLTYDYGRITPAELQEAAKRWLVPGKSFSLVVLPEAKGEAK